MSEEEPAMASEEEPAIASEEERATAFEEGSAMASGGEPAMSSTEEPAIASEEEASSTTQTTIEDGGGISYQEGSPAWVNRALLSALKTTLYLLSTCSMPLKQLHLRQKRRDKVPWCSTSAFEFQRSWHHTEKQSAIKWQPQTRTTAFPKNWSRPR